MAPNAIAGLLLAVFALVIGVAQLGDTFNKGYVYVLSAAAVTGLSLSMVWSATGGSVMAGEEKEGTAKYKGFGQEITIPARWQNGILVCALAAAAYFFHDHHKISMENDRANKELLQRIYEATQQNTRAIRAQTFVLTLSQERREKLNLDTPDEIRQMQRHREP